MVKLYRTETEDMYVFKVGFLKKRKSDARE